jgi:hypothetical protein
MPATNPRSYQVYDIDWKQERDMEAAEARWESDRDDRLLNTGSAKP